MAATIQLQRDSWAARRIAPPAWAAGAAGLGYVVAAGVENMELLRSPLPGAGAAAVRSAYADQALAAATAVAGVLSLLLYVAFAASLAPRLSRPRPALAGALAGAAVAFAGIAASAPLVLGADLSDAAVRSAFDLQQTLRLLAGPAMALFLASLGLSRVLPRPLSRLACAIALPLAFAPLAELAGGQAAYIAAYVVFGLHSLCILLASLWLAVGRGVAVGELVRRAAFLMLVVAAGLVGLALLAVPRSSGSFFAWQLRPPSLAAFAGGVYVGSAVLYAAALNAPWRQARALVAAAVVLSVSVFAVTLAHLDLFDLGRLQAWAWLVLFAGFAVTMGLLLVTRRGADRRGGAAPPGWARAVLAIVAAALAAVAVGLWIDPAGLPPLGGRFAGSWTALLGFLAGWAALANRRDEARLPALGLIALPAGALLGALRTMEGEPVYVAGLVLLIAFGAVVYARATEAPRPARGR